MKIVRNLGTLTFQVQITPPPRKFKLRQILALCDFSSADYPPQNLNLGRSWHFVIFQVQITPPPRKFKLRQILALCDFSSADYPLPPII